MILVYLFGNSVISWIGVLTNMNSIRIRERGGFKIVGDVGLSPEGKFMFWGFLGFF